MKSVEHYCAEFLISHCAGPQWKAYRQRCLALWRETYGERAAAVIEAKVRAGYEQAKGKAASKAR